VWHLKNTLANLRPTSYGDGEHAYDNVFALAY